MPTTMLNVERVDHSRYTGKMGSSIDDYLVTGIEQGAYTEQFHTTSVFMAAVCQRGKDLQKPVSVLWRDHRAGKTIVDVELTA